MNDSILLLLLLLFGNTHVLYLYESIEQALMFYYVLIMVKAVWPLGLDKN